MQPLSPPSLAAAPGLWICSTAGTAAPARQRAFPLPIVHRGFAHRRPSVPSLVAGTSRHYFWDSIFPSVKAPICISLPFPAWRPFSGVLSVLPSDSMASQGPPSSGEVTASMTKGSKGVRNGNLKQSTMASMINEAVEEIFSSRLPTIIRACKSPSYPSPAKAGRKRRTVLQPDAMSIQILRMIPPSVKEV